MRQPYPQLYRCWRYGQLVQGAAGPHPCDEQFPLSAVAEDRYDGDDMIRRRAIDTDGGSGQDTAGGGTAAARGRIERGGAPVTWM